MRRFAGIDLGWASAADETTILNFRRMSYAGKCWTESTQHSLKAAPPARRPGLSLCSRPLRSGIREILRPFRSSHIYLNVAVRQGRSRYSAAKIRHPYVS